MYTNEFCNSVKIRQVITKIKTSLNKTVLIYFKRIR